MADTTVEHRRVQFEGRKRAWVVCKRLGKLARDGQGKRATETTYGCETCAVNHCLDCF